MKFGRLFTMEVDGNSLDTATGLPVKHLIQFPLTCKFRVTNSSLFTCGSAVFQIYNLSPDVRSDIFKDVYQSILYRGLTFSAGYQANSANPGAVTLPVIFKGNILQAYSFRQGPDWITEIQALDGGFAVENGSINLTKPTPYNFNDVLTDIVNAMPRVTLGVIGAFDIANTRGLTFSGNPWDFLTKRILPFNAQAYINKETVNIVQQWEYVEEAGSIDTLDEESGVIGTPRSQDGLVKVRMIFEPRMEIGQKIKVSSAEIPVNRNGDYKVLMLIHGGTISGAECGELTTDVTLLQPDQTLEAA